LIPPAPTPVHIVHQCSSCPAASRPPGLNIVPITSSSHLFEPLGQEQGRTNQEYNYMTQADQRAKAAPVLYMQHMLVVYSQYRYIIKEKTGRTKGTERTERTPRDKCDKVAPTGQNRHQVHKADKHDSSTSRPPTSRLEMRTKDNRRRMNGRKICEIRRQPTLWTKDNRPGTNYLAATTGNGQPATALRKTIDNANE